MQHFKLLFKFLFILSFSKVEANYFNTYLDLVANKCSEVNPLIVKKSLIFLLKDQDDICEDIFSQKIIKECAHINNCATLYEILGKAMHKHSGNIIGVTKD